MARIALPLLGLALLSSLFLVASGRPDPKAGPAIRAAALGIARERRVTAPVHAGMTADGAAFHVTAASARPDPSDPRIMTAQDLTARMDTAAGTAWTMDAARGRLNPEAQTFLAAGGMRLIGSSGIDVTAASGRMHLDRAAAELAGPVRGRGPFGEIEAGALSIEGDRARFTGGVEAVYLPPARTAPAPTPAPPAPAPSGDSP